MQIIRYSRLLKRIVELSHVTTFHIMTLSHSLNRYFVISDDYGLVFTISDSRFGSSRISTINSIADNSILCITGQLHLGIAVNL